MMYEWMDDEWGGCAYKKVAVPKEHNPELKMIIGSGGWDDAANLKYSKVKSYTFFQYYF